MRPDLKTAAPYCGLFFARTTGCAETLLQNLDSASGIIFLRTPSKRGPTLMTSAYTQALVADDDPISRGIVSEQLMRLGVSSIRSASSGRQALNALQRDPDIRLLITDLKMPDMDGIRLLRELSSMGREIDVIIMSALGGKILQAARALCKDTDGMRVLGVTGKPVELKTLQSMLNSGAEGADSLPPAHNGNPIEAALDSGQHHSVVQPIVETANNSCHWVELSSRWTHPQLAQRDPASITREAEGSELIHSILRHTLRDAGQAHKTWLKEQFAAPRISFNLTARHLRDRSLADWSATVAARFVLQPEQLIFEIPEPALATAGVLAMAKALAETGFGVVIDAFGSGDSSMDLLKSLPIRALKTDASLVRRVSTAFEAQMLVESAVQIADSLGVDAVATGVDNASARSTLSNMGYHLMQGKLFGEPVDIDTYAQWIAQSDLQAAVPPQAASAA